MILKIRLGSIYNYTFFCGNVTNNLEILNNCLHYERLRNTSNKNEFTKTNFFTI